MYELRNFTFCNINSSKIDIVLLNIQFIYITMGNKIQQLIMIYMDQLFDIPLWYLVPHMKTP